MRNSRGVTMIELVIVIVITAIIARAFSAVMVPMMNAFLYAPESSRVNNAAADVLQAIIEGDEKAEGLRFAGPPCEPSDWLTSTNYVVGDYVQNGGLNYYCLINHTSGTFATDLAAGRWTTTAAWATATSYVVGNYVSQGYLNYTCTVNHTSGVFATDLAAGRWSVNPITAATATTLTYNYAATDLCGGGTGAKNNNSVALAYSSANQIVTRSVNGGTAVEIPYYATAASGIEINPPSGVSFFRYYDSAGTEMTGGGIVLVNIYRVDITVNATSGSGSVKHNAGQILLKSGVEIKRYTT